MRFNRHLIHVIVAKYAIPNGKQIFGNYSVIFLKQKGDETSY